MSLAALALVLAQVTDFQAEGRKALDAQKFAEAAELFGKAVAADPKDYSAHFHLALAYSLLDKDAQAIAEYKETLALSPGLYQAELNLGILLLRQKQPGAAVPYLKSAAAKKPSEFRPNFYLAEALAGSGDAAGSIDMYKAALAADPTAKDAELGLARALAKLGRTAEAEPHFKNAGGQSLLELAVLYQSQHKLEQAAELFAQVAPSDPAAAERAGALYLELGKPSLAIAVLELATKAAPTSANRVALGQALIKDKQIDRGLEEIGKAVELEPRDPELRLFYGRNLRDQKKYAPASSQFLIATQIKPDLLQAWNELAAMRIIMEDWSGAISTLDRVKSLGGETVSHLYLRAISLDHLHQKPQAVEYYTKFLAAAGNAFPDEEFKARQRMRILQTELNKR
jgi:tetratricopeptide (TPR) repeat protein